jgi:hypothetical protein
MCSTNVVKRPGEEVVDPPDVVPRPSAARQVRADEACRTGYQDAHSRALIRAADSPCCRANLDESVWSWSWRMYNTSSITAGSATAKNLVYRSKSGADGNAGSNPPTLSVSVLRQKIAPPSMYSPRRVISTCTGPPR